VVWPQFQIGNLRAVAQPLTDSVVAPLVVCAFRSRRKAGSQTGRFSRVTFETRCRNHRIGTLCRFPLSALCYRCHPHC
jgi:hypothetical protein